VSEQQRLEFGMQTVPKNDPERWTRIADIVGTRSKEECVARVKQIVAHIKAQQKQKIVA
jgi:hypothetical protein